MNSSLSLPLFQLLPQVDFFAVRLSSVFSNVIPPSCLFRSSAQSPSCPTTKRSPSSQFDIIASLVSNNPRVRLLCTVQRRLHRFQQPKSRSYLEFYIASLVSNNPKVHPLRSSTSPPSFPTGQKVVFFADPRRARHDWPHSISHGL